MHKWRHLIISYLMFSEHPGSVSFILENSLPLLLWIFLLSLFLFLLLLLSCISCTFGYFPSVFVYYLSFLKVFVSSFAFQCGKLQLAQFQDHWFFSQSCLISWWSHQSCFLCLFVLVMVFFILAFPLIYLLIRFFHLSTYYIHLFLHVVYFFH